jgi:hypothetical protein
VKKIEVLLKEQVEARLPPLGEGCEVGRIDLYSLDSYTAGCISTYVDRGNLDPWRLSMLGICYGELCTVVPLLIGESQQYYEKWKELAELVLREISNKTRIEFQ